MFRTVNAEMFAFPVGSFVGLVADRLPRGEQMLLGRSACRECHTILAPRDLVPLFSWLALRGKCRACRAPIGLLHRGRQDFFEVDTFVGSPVGSV